MWNEKPSSVSKRAFDLHKEYNIPISWAMEAVLYCDEHEGEEPIEYIRNKPEWIGIRACKED